MLNIPTWVWVVFWAVILALLVVDLVAHRGRHGESHKAAVIWTGVWISAGLLFGALVWRIFGTQAGHEYLAAYFIEKSLSLDNVFVFLVIFRSLGVPSKAQHNVLFLGIFGALVFRALFIFLGAAALERWHWVAYVFGGILLVTAWRVFREDPAVQVENKAVRWLAHRMPVTHEFHGKKFIVRLENGRRVATPLLLALLGLELTDILFAVDSVPAAFSVTQDTFIIYSSNAFAILGLRALYLLLAGTVGQLRYLHYGLAGVLAFAGLKMVLEPWLHVPPLTSVAIIAVLIIGSVWASRRVQKREALSRARLDEAGRGDGVERPRGPTRHTEVEA
ncbi:TerC/Alx family metal homeostasis membrane protein [Pyxidicoccus fallax]|uniref:TerC/Alx family metal homeostasis membrane protein n=1 Tax=Pyxidicoccus fallax TaxID=394095 RepID=A0A848LYE6_9BACT|nr:TerC/Alx family metal homeostasis membrane protein [Pyxidicoccus fallax]NMO22649.1 TerC/Alx family metal homeostasis membrane protein [Pyxidicoccus fallax]NPC84728.1 TerC/Alx family metal homeostasis membrane protein [Pyxidicoccus fallax]